MNAGEAIAASRCRRHALLREDDLRGAGLRAGSSVFVHDARLHSLVHRSSVSGSGRLGRSGVVRRQRNLQLLVQRLDLGFDAFVASGKAHAFTRGFDGRFRVGHGGLEIQSRTETQTGPGESRVLSER